MSGKNIILTGCPRGGTTLMTALIDNLPDAVALNEPMWQFEWMMRNAGTSGPKDFARWIAGDFAATRQKLLKGIPVEERRGERGEAVTNYYRKEPDAAEVNKSVSFMDFTRSGLTPDFTLAIKHTSPFLAILRQLAELKAFTIVAIVRHPVGVIGSWREVPIPPGRGEMPGAMVYWNEMRELVQRPMDLLDKQVRMVDLICKRLHNLRDVVHVIRYEDLIEEPGMLYRLIGLEHVKPLRDVPVKKRTLSFYPEADVIRERVLKIGEYYKLFYNDL